MKAARLAVLLAIGAGSLLGCAPSPDEIKVTTRTSPFAAPEVLAEPETRLYVGDLIAVEASPVDGNDTMKLCLEVSTSDPKVADVKRSIGACDEPRVFVITAQGAGTARIRFGARDTWKELSVVVLDTP